MFCRLVDLESGLGAKINPKAEIPGIHVTRHYIVRVANRDMAHLTG